MTKKNLFLLSVKASQVALREFFNDPKGFADVQFFKGKQKHVAQAVYAALSFTLLDPVEPVVSEEIIDEKD